MSNSLIVLLKHWSNQSYGMNQSVSFMSCQEIIYSLCGEHKQCNPVGFQPIHGGTSNVHKMGSQVSQSSSFNFEGFLKSVSSVELSVSSRIIAVSSVAASKPLSSIGSCLFLKSCAQHASTSPLMHQFNIYTGSWPCFW